MDAEYANYYTREVMLILIREFQSPDEEMKKIVLKVRHLKTSPQTFSLDLSVSPLVTFLDEVRRGVRLKSENSINLAI